MTKRLKKKRKTDRQIMAVEITGTRWVEAGIEVPVDITDVDITDEDLREISSLVLWGELGESDYHSYCPEVHVVESDANLGLHALAFRDSDGWKVVPALTPVLAKQRRGKVHSRIATALMRGERKSPPNLR